MPVTRLEMAPDRTHPVGDEVLRALPLVSPNNASEQPLCVPLWWLCLRPSVAQRCQNTSLCCALTIGVVVPIGTQPNRAEASSGRVAMRIKSSVTSWGLFCFGEGPAKLIG